jgi:hypothetical protein
MPPALGDIGVFRQLQDLTRRLNSLTKYPSIPTYHSLDAKGKITEQVEEDLAQENVVATEKVDGTNARILLVGADKWSAPQLYIGSRADLLFRAGDGLWRDDNQIVEALLPRVVKWSDALHFPGLTVLYGEVYGGKINGWKNYTGAGALGFRLFDAWRMSHDQVDDRLGAEPAALAQWRDAGGQPRAGGRPKGRCGPALARTALDRGHVRLGAGRTGRPDPGCSRRRGRRHAGRGRPPRRVLRPEVQDRPPRLREAAAVMVEDRLNAVADRILARVIVR